MPQRGELDQPRAVQREHEAAADHVLEGPVLLAPVPGAAEFLGQRPAALAGVMGDELADEGHLTHANFPAAVAEQYTHGPGS